MASDFWELYKHPLWQEKRLRIMERECFTCERCESSDDTLNVHHAFYRKGKKPWEYEDRVLHCLCESCHKEIHAEKERALFALSMMNRDDAEQSIGYMEAWVACRRGNSVFINNINTARGFCDFWGIDFKLADALVGNDLDDHDVRSILKLEQNAPEYDSANYFNIGAK